MIETASLAPSSASFTDYAETRRHEFHKRRLLMVDGALTVNVSQAETGTSARVYRGGYWGFAAEPGLGDAAAAARLQRRAGAHADALGRFGPRPALDLPGQAWRGEQPLRGRPPIGQGEAAERLAALAAWCRARYPGLKSVRVALADEQHAKWLSTSRGGESLARIQRALCYVYFVAEAADGRPIELWEPFSCQGSLADLELDGDALAPQLDALHEHVQAKRRAVPARGGPSQVVLAPALAGMLAHEAMGHPCEADLVLSGAVTAGLLGRPVASELVSMVDIAHHWRGQEVMMPVYVDDEGLPAEDVLLIDRGRLAGFMHSRETAARLGQAPTGSARAYAPGDEPLVRMRNTAILPGSSRLDEMIAGVDQGYLLLKTANGQADSTTEFMFGITLGYEIRDGRLGAAIADTTVSGTALQVLRDVDAVSDDMHWSANGYCGKKQSMVVAMGGPALRTRLHVGGQ